MRINRHTELIYRRPLITSAKKSNSISQGGACDQLIAHHFKPVMRGGRTTERYSAIKAQ